MFLVTTMKILIIKWWRLWCWCWKKLTLIQRQSDNGRVTRITIIETPVRKNAAGPGPSGSAEKKLILCFLTSRSDFENLFLYYITSISLSHYFNVLPSDWCSKNFFRNSHWSPAVRGRGVLKTYRDTLHL